MRGAGVSIMAKRADRPEAAVLDESENVSSTHFQGTHLSSDNPSEIE